MALKAKGNILIAREMNPDETPGGIKLPEQRKVRVPRIVVLSVGPGKYVDGVGLVAPDVKPGDVLLASRGVPVDDEGQEFFCVDADDVYAQVE